MSKVKFIHCGDNHLDTPFSSLNDSPGSSQIRRQDLKDNFQKIIELSKEECMMIICLAENRKKHLEKILGMLWNPDSPEFEPWGKEIKQLCELREQVMRHVEEDYVGRW